MPASRRPSVDFVTNLESRLHHLDKQARASKTIALRRDRSWSSYAHIEVSKLPKDVDDLVALFSTLAADPSAGPDGSLSHRHADRAHRNAARRRIAGMGFYHRVREPNNAVDIRPDSEYTLEEREAERSTAKEMLRMLQRRHARHHHETASVTNPGTGHYRAIPGEPNLGNPNPKLPSHDDGGSAECGARFRHEHGSLANPSGYQWLVEPKRLVRCVLLVPVA